MINMLDRRTKFKTWLSLAKFASNLEALDVETLTRPERIGKRKTPATLNDMTIGQMVELSACKTVDDMFYLACNVLMGMSKTEVDKSKATEVVKFVGWVIGSLERINAFFDKAKVRPDSKQIQAGYNNLNFGIFGLIDWYACRMGITDHEDVMHVVWGRVYKCLEMDNKTMMYQKRLNEIYANDNRRKN